MFNNLNILLANFNTSTYKNLSISEAKELLTTRFSTALDMYINGNYTFYRLDDIKANYLLYTPGERKSRSKINKFIFLYSLLPSWQNYPRRHNSVCLMNDTDFAYDFGKYTKLVFPENDAILGVTNKSDFNYTQYKNSNIAMYNIMYIITSIISYYCNCNISADKYNMSVEYTNNWINKCDNNIKSDNVNKDIFNFINMKKDEIYALLIDVKYNTLLYHFFASINYLYEKSSNIKVIDIINDANNIGVLNTLDKYLNSTKFQINYTTIENYNPSNYAKNYEIWTEGTCLMINCNNSKTLDSLIPSEAN